jgi:hypothetical protein
VTGEPDALAVEYTEWLDRVCATYQAVHYTCAHRLADPALAGPVAVQVAAGLIARPAVFRYFGLPYSGRIARLAEARLAEADAGELATVCDWPQLRERLERMPLAHRDVLVVTCVRGGDVDMLATTLGCDQAAAKAGHQAMLAFMHELARPGLPKGPDPDGEV